MNLPKLRRGMTCRIYDAGKWSLIFEHGYGSTNVARIELVYRSERSLWKRGSIPVQLRWRTAYRLRKYGVLHLYKIQAKVIDRLFYLS